MIKICLFSTFRVNLGYLGYLGTPSQTWDSQEPQVPNLGYKLTSGQSKFKLRILKYQKSQLVFPGVTRVQTWALLRNPKFELGILRNPKFKLGIGKPKFELGLFSDMDQWRQRLLATRELFLEDDKEDDFNVRWDMELGLSARSLGIGSYPLNDKGSMVLK